MSIAGCESARSTDGRMLIAELAYRTVRMPGRRGALQRLVQRERLRGSLLFVLVLVETVGQGPSVLIWNCAPAEDGYHRERSMAVLLSRIDINAQHRAVVLPVVTKVKDVLERFTDPEAGRAEREVPFIQALTTFIEPVRVRHYDRASTGEMELVQKCVGSTDEEVAPRRLA